MEKAQKRSKTVRTQFGTILAVVVAASATLSAAATTYTSASYVQDGLITQWDGIDNAGTGAHNPNATVWKDLAGNLDLTLTANGSWTNGNALAVNGASAVGTTKAPLYKTIEIVYSKPFQAKSCVFFHSGYTNRFVVFRYLSSIAPTNHVYFEAYQWTKYITKRTSAGEITSAVALYGDEEVVSDVFCDGERRTDGTYYEGWGNRKRVSVGGRFSDNSTQNENYPSQGEVYAIRLYSRRLTKAELAHNNIVDRKRFMTSACYTQDGLIGQWDGEDNAGTGEHDPSATSWKDLKGNLDLALVSGRGGWNAAGNALTVSGPSAIGESPMPVFRTIELAFRQTYNEPAQHNPIMLNPSGDERQMIFFRDHGRYMFFSANAASGGPKHPSIDFGQQYNSNAVRVVAATYTNVATAVARVYWDGSAKTPVNVSDYWGVNVRKMLIGLNYTDRQFARSWYGDLYTLRFYDRELTADELAADAAMDQKRIFAPRVITWKNLSDGNFGTSGKWTVSGTGMSGQNIPRYSDHVFLTNGNYTVTLDEDWAIGELSVGAGAALKFDLPSDATATNVVRLTVFGKVEADAAARIVLDAEAFGKAYKDGQVTLISCDTASAGALQDLADNVSFVGGRRLGRVDVSDDGKALVYTVLPQGTVIYFK